MITLRLIQKADHLKLNTLKTTMARKDDEYLFNRKMIHEVRKEVSLNSLITLQQAFEAKTSLAVEISNSESANDPTDILPDYPDIA